MQPFEQLLIGLTDKQLPLKLNRWQEKSLQSSSICPSYSAVTEFKHSFISSFSTIEEGLFETAIRISKGDAALGIIAFELAKTGKIKCAMNLLRDIPYAKLGNAINRIVFRLCNDSQLNNAMMFLTHIPKDFYEDESHMAIEDAFQQVVINLIQAGRRHNAQLLAMRIPEGPLKASITHLADNFLPVSQ